MRTLLVLLIALLVFALGGAQDYRPAAGETALKVTVEGRGSFFVKLHTREAPRTTAHILGLVRRQFYDGQRFHRVVRQPRPYLVQIGDPASRNDVESAGSGGSGARIPFEDSGYKHVTGAVALAALTGEKDQGDSQFYIMLAPAGFLDGNYTVFGQVVQGMDVVQRIQRGDRVSAVTVLGG